MRIRSPRWMYPLMGLILGLGAPVGAFALRYYLMPDVRLNPAGELASHRFVYLYELFGPCFAFSVAGVVAGWHTERLRRAEAFYQNLSEHDPLTGLYNERAFRDRYERSMERAARTHQPISLLLIDVDYLKTVNDRYGHLIGNEALVHVARALRRAKRADDSAARWGGDEFAILLEGGDANAARRVADSVLQRLRRSPLVAPRGVIRITVTIGICSASGIAIGKDLFAVADRALYAGKRAGRDRATLVHLGGVPEDGLEQAESI
jgi:diguanylate cyclase (GGDEF)-like protein